MTAEVIKFPIKSIKKINSPPGDEEQVAATVDTMKHAHIQETLLAISPMLFERLHAAGFDFSEFSDEKEIQYGAFIVESIHALLCKYYELYHPFQTISENIFVKDENDELTLVDELHLKFIENTSETTA